MKTNNYYNTTLLGDPALSRAIEAALTQEDTVLRFFKLYNRQYTPSEVWDKYARWPITSIRRAITNLTNAGELTKTTKMRIGFYGKPEHVWKLSLTK